MNEPRELPIAELEIGEGEPLPRAATRALLGFFLRRVASGSADPEEMARSLMTEPYGPIAGSMDAAAEAIRNKLDPPRALPKWNRRPKKDKS